LRLFHKQDFIEFFEVLRSRYLEGANLSLNGPDP
ncbi:MAG: hypothetical protein ACI87N_003575, partial [Flavobacteriales bacterium]